MFDNYLGIRYLGLSHGLCSEDIDAQWDFQVLDMVIFSLGIGYLGPIYLP